MNARIKKHNRFSIALVLALLPVFAQADVEVHNSTQINNSTSASASSGGQSVDTGGSSRTNDASASAHSRAITTDEGTSVYIEKTENGHTITDSYTKEPGEAVHVEVSSVSNSSGSASEASASVDVNAHVSGDAMGAASTSVDTNEKGLAASSTIRKSILSFFSRFFTFLGF
jgi:hypothetical protein